LSELRLIAVVQIGFDLWPKMVIQPTRDRYCRAPILGQFRPNSTAFEGRRSTVCLSGDFAEIGHRLALLPAVHRAEFNWGEPM
jgi:hypothetical protein